MKLPTAIAILLLGSGCSSAAPPSPNGSEAAVSARASLGTLRTRDRELTLFASPSGLKVSVRTSTGALIADDVALETLRTIDPQLYELCRSGVASNAPYLDATFHPRTERAEDGARTEVRGSQAPAWDR